MARIHTQKFHFIIFIYIDCRILVNFQETLIERQRRRQRRRRRLRDSHITVLCSIQQNKPNRKYKIKNKIFFAMNAERKRERETDESRNKDNKKKCEVFIAYTISLDAVRHTHTHTFEHAFSVSDQFTKAYASIRTKFNGQNVYTKREMYSPATYRPSLCIWLFVAAVHKIFIQKIQNETKNKSKMNACNTHTHTHTPTVSLPVFIFRFGFPKGINGRVCVRRKGRIGLRCK